MLDAGCSSDDDTVQRCVLVVLARLAGLARLGAGHIHDLGASFQGGILLVFHGSTNRLDAGALELQVAALAIRAEVPSRRGASDA
ncbi:hypothetical protein D3C77_642780 [compost metagenome]